MAKIEEINIGRSKAIKISNGHIKTDEEKAQLRQSIVPVFIVNKFPL